MNTSLTQWVELADRLRTMIHSGEFNGGRLPNEPAMARELGVSRGTLRRALQQLEHEGLVIRKHGSGTYINTAVLQIMTRLDEVWDFAEMIQIAGYQPSVQHVETRLEITSPKVQLKLNLNDATAEVIAVANVFLADNRPVIYCLDILAGHLVRQAYAPEELHGPIYAFLNRRCHQQVSYNIAEIRPVTAEPKIAAYLKCREGTALHYFEEVGYNAQHQPILYSEEYYIPDAFRFQTVRRMMSSQS